MEAPETIDMLYCLKEVCSIYSAKPEAVAKASFDDCYCVRSLGFDGDCGVIWCGG